MNILITGSSGFIGKNLILELSSNFNLFVPKKNELDILNLDAIKKYLHQNSIQGIIHLANLGGSRKDNNLDNVFSENLKMFLNISAVEPMVEKIIFLGSGAEYDKSRDLKMIKESDFGQHMPKDDYGLAKFACSKIIAGMQKAVNLRCFGVYGVYEDFEQRFISYAILRSLLNLSIVIKQNTIFEYVYVKDLCHIIRHFLENSVAEKFYNVGTGQPLSLLSLAEIVKQTTGGSAEIKTLQAGLGREYSCDYAKFKAEMPNFTFTPHQQAILEMTQWYKDNLNKLNLSRIKLEQPL